MDNANPRRRPTAGLFVGSELKTSPSVFLLGLGVDFAQGMQLSVGVTHYASAELAKGWMEGQEIAKGADGMLLANY